MIYSAYDSNNRASFEGGFMRSLRAASIGAVALVGFALSGCATFEGAPRRVIDGPASMNLVGRYPIDESIKRFSYPDEDYYNWTYREGLTRQQYRDMVVTVYMNAMDSRYHEFRTLLSSERRQADFGLDLAVLGFTGWASVAKESIVNNLSAVAAGFAGARGVVQKDLYFDKALPAIIAAMDADRLRARAQMVEYLKRPAGDYPLQTAFGDLMGYEVASSLDGAITRITTEATQDREEAQQELSAAIQSCQADADAVEIVTEISDYVRDIYDLAADQSNPATAQTNFFKLWKIGQVMNISPPDNVDALLESILGRIGTGKEGNCRKAELEALFTRIKAVN